MRVFDTGDIRSHNTSMVLKLIWSELAMSRAEVARRLGMSRSTVSNIVSSLQAMGIVHEVGEGLSKGGRRPILVGIAQESHFLLGVELGARHLSVVACSLRGKIVSSAVEEYSVQTDPQGTLARVEALLEEMAQSLPGAWSGVLGIGLGVPSPVHDENPGRLSPQILPAWAGIDLIGYFENCFQLPVFMENDANLGALAEQWWGHGEDGQDLTYIKVATGVGSGHIIHGEIYRGSRGYAGEVGHTAIEPSDPRLNYGMRSSLTSLVGTEAILGRSKALRSRFPESDLQEEPTLADFIAACAEGDPLCVAVMEEVGVYLGVAIANLLHILNPPIVVLGGAVTAVGECLFHPLRQTVRDRTLWGAIKECEIVRTKLSENAIAVGASTLVLRAVLGDPAQFLTRHVPAIGGVT